MDVLIDETFLVERSEYETLSSGVEAEHANIFVGLVEIARRCPDIALEVNAWNLRGGSAGPYRWEFEEGDES